MALRAKARSQSTQTSVSLSHYEHQDRQRERQQERKYLGTVETLSILLEHRKILSQCIREMDKEGHNYITEQFLFSQVKNYIALVKTDVQKRVQYAFASDNLLQSHIVSDIETGQGENRLYFQQAVIAVVRLCDVSLFKKLTDVQLKAHLQFLNQALNDMQRAKFEFTDTDDDFVEFIDKLLMNIGDLLSNVKRNVVKMRALGKELEDLTASSVKDTKDINAFVEAKQQWLEKIVKLYNRHIMPVLQFLNPETSYQDLHGLHAVLSKMSDVCHSHQHIRLADNLQSYALSFLNYYQPIEATATAINRFIHKERDSIKRFNAIEHFYQNTLLNALAETQKDNLSKRFMGKEGIVLTHFSPFIKSQIRPQGYAFNSSTAYFKNLFNELEARTQDVFAFNDLSSVFAKASKNEQALARQQRYQALIKWLSQTNLRETNDLIKLLHMRLSEVFETYELYDLISAVQYYAYSAPLQSGPLHSPPLHSAAAATTMATHAMPTNTTSAASKSMTDSKKAVTTGMHFALCNTNHFSSIEYKQLRYRYRIIKVLNKELT